MIWLWVSKVLNIADSQSHLVMLRALKSHEYASLILYGTSYEIFHVKTLKLWKGSE